MHTTRFNDYFEEKRAEVGNWKLRGSHVEEADGRTDVIQLA